MPWAEFPVFPVGTGILAIVPEKCQFGTENCEANQLIAGQFPAPAKREFILA
jgi:hypothetical protein